MWKTRLLAGVLVIIVSLPSIGLLTYSEDDEEQPALREGWFGIYVSGAKVGFSHWVLERKNEKGKQFYSLIMKEERKTSSGKGKDSGDYTATFGLDYSPQSMESVESRNGMKTFIKGSIKDGNVGIAVRFAEKDKPTTSTFACPKFATWQFCAPLIFALTKHSQEEETADFGYVNPMGKNTVSLKLSVSASSVTYLGEAAEALEWCDPDGKCKIVVLAEGDSLISSTMCAKGATKVIPTKYLSEPEDVAKSDKSYDQSETVKKPDKDDPGDKDKGKDEGKKSAKKGKPTGRFKGALDPVADDAEDNEMGASIPYIKSTQHQYAMNFAEGWSLVNMEFVISKTETITLPGVMNMEKAGIALIFLVAERKKEKSPKEVLKDFLARVETWESEGKSDEATFDEYTKVAGQSVKMKTQSGPVPNYVFASISEKYTYIVTLDYTIATGSDYEKIEDDMFKMLGSFRILPPPGAKE
ncbi:MAG: hypothetical protein WC712_10845 [Candidatus Brocadiia bacterium]